MASPATPSAPPTDDAANVTESQADTIVMTEVSPDKATSQEAAPNKAGSQGKRPHEATSEKTAGQTAAQTAVKSGKLIVLAGPSGVGKGTLLKRLLQANPQIKVSVSATTRQPRSGEVDKRDYFFLSRPQFDALVSDNALLEWAEFAGNCYGTPKAPIEEAIQQGQRVILEIELLGARQVRKSFPEAKQIFILPPNPETLEARIRSRGQDSETAINKRLSQAKVELAAADEFDLQIVNDDLEKALEELTAAIFE